MLYEYIKPKKKKKTEQNGKEKLTLRRRRYETVAAAQTIVFFSSSTQYTSVTGHLSSAIDKRAPSGTRERVNPRWTVLSEGLARALRLVLFRVATVDEEEERNVSDSVSPRLESSLLRAARAGFNRQVSDNRRQAAAEISPDPQQKRRQRNFVSSR